MSPNPRSGRAGGIPVRPGPKRDEVWMNLIPMEVEILRAFSLGLTREQIASCYDITYHSLTGKTRVIRKRMARAVGRYDMLTLEHCVALYASSDLYAEQRHS